ncbi:MAG: hypothetical protein WD097_00290 [Balneolales bacterium]
MKYTCRTLCLAFAVVLISIPVSGNNFAQAQPADSVRYGFLPAFSYDSDNGLYVALELQRFFYQPDIQPYGHFSRANVSFRTIGAYSVYIARDQVRTFHTDIRTWADALVSRNYGNYYTGDTFTDGFSQSAFDTTNYYQFSSFMYNIGVTTRIPVSPIKQIQRSDVKFGLRVVYEKPFDLDPDGFMAQRQPVGWNGAAYVLGETGYIIEKRDSESLPGTGYFYGFTIRAALPGISATHAALFTSDFRWYRNLTRRASIPYFIFAQKIMWEHSMGEVPYWLQPNLGGSGGLRGYIWRRFTSDGLVLSMNEIRAVLVQLPWWDIRLGLNGFVDAGSVYNRSLTEWDPRITYGFAGIFSVSGSEYYLKYEMGFSPEGIGINIGSGYAF